MTTSERRLWGRCPQAHWWAYREGLTPRDPDRGARWFGTGVHEVLAQWYGKRERRGLRPDVAWARWVKGEEDEWVRSSVTTDFNDDVFVKAAELGEAMLLGYYQKYGRDESWDIVAIEQFGQLLIPQRNMHKKRPLVLYSFTFDGVMRLGGELWLIEHKTATQVRTHHLPHDEQGGTYFLLAEIWLRRMGILGPRERLAGILYNFLRKAIPDQRPRNAGGAYLNLDGTVSKKQPAPYFVRPDPVERTLGERRSILENLQVQAEVMLAQRRDELPLWKNRTPDCTFCDFYAMCQLHDDDPSDGAPWEEYRDAMYVRRDPYAYQHKKSASDD